MLDLLTQIKCKTFQTTDIFVTLHIEVYDLTFTIKCLSVGKEIAVALRVKREGAYIDP